MWTQEITDSYIKNPQEAELYYYGTEIGIRKEYFSIGGKLLRIPSKIVNKPFIIIPSYSNTFWGNSCYAKEPDYYKIISDFTNLVSKNSKASKYYSDMADFYFYILYTEDSDSIWLEYAENDYNNAIKLEPDNSSFYCKRGIFYYYNENYEKAIADFTKSLEIKLTAEAILFRAFCYEAKENINLACRDYVSVIELKDISKQYIEQARELINCEELKNCCAKIFYTNGQNYLKENNFDMAIYYFKEALELTNDKQYENAISEIENLKNKFEKFEQLTKWGMEYYYDGDYELAEKYIKEALEIKPENNLCIDLLNKIKKQMVDLMKCSKEAILTLDGFNEDKANAFVIAREEGAKWYDIDSFADDFEISGYEKLQIQNRLIFPLKQGAKLGRKIDF